jgi:hypothetical protein
MAFGIDDALAAAAAGISLADTIVQTIKRYKKSKKDYDLELLLEQVRITALERINDADLALNQFERMLKDREINLGSQIDDVIKQTPFWRPFEQHRLSQIKKRFNEFSDSVYCAGDDIAALVRCHQDTGEMGIAVAETVKEKREFQTNVAHAHSIGEAIDLLRAQLDKHKIALTS